MKHYTTGLRGTVGCHIFRYTMPRAKANSRSKRPDKPSVSNNHTVTMVPQAHGGALQVGNPGNSGGTGRPPNEIRARMRMHLDAELIQACLDDWKSGKLNPLQVAEFFAKHALPTQSEALNEDEGKAYARRTIGRLIDLLRAEGRYTDLELHELCVKSLEGDQ